MMVFGFGRSEKEKFLATPQNYSIGFVEYTNYEEVEKAIENVFH